MALSLEQVMAEAKDPENRRTATARILLRQGLLQRHAELDARLTATIEADRKLNREEEAPALRAEIEALEAEIEEAFVTFTFANVGHRKWADLSKEHPPTDEQIAEHGRLDHNPDTFPVAAIAASCIEPEMTVEGAVELATVISPTQFMVLWNACLDANTGGLESPKSQAAGAIRLLSAAFESMRAPAASPAPSSSGE